MGGRAKVGIERRSSCSDAMLNYRFSQKHKLLGNSEFSHLTIILTLPPHVDSNFLLISEVQHLRFLTFGIRVGGPEFDPCLLHFTSQLNN